MMVDLPMNDIERFLMFLLTEYRDNILNGVCCTTAAGFYSGTQAR